MGPTAGRNRETWGQERRRNKLDFASWGMAVRFLRLAVAVRGMSILFGMAIGFVAICGWFTEGHQVRFHVSILEVAICSSQKLYF
jgi:hypothetical protein